MKLERLHLTVEQISKDFYNNDDGAGGLGGKLDIRPFYQRESIYDIKRKELVIDSIINGYPLNIMYFAKKTDGTYEVLDGQQRILSFCEFVSEGGFSVEHRSFGNFYSEEKEKILNYTPMIYTCEGTDTEKLNWFERINVAGLPLTSQELRNAVYSGPWVSAAKRYFSKPNCPAGGLADKYIKGRVSRQEFLERAIQWHICSKEDEKIRDYMNKHCKESNADELQLYFEAVIAWVKAKFKIYRNEMQYVDWGMLYNRHKNDTLDANKLEKEIETLMTDPDVGNRKGIYEFILSNKLPNDERLLNLRLFDNEQKRLVYEKQKGICTKCGKKFELKQMEADHITPWSQGGKTNIENCQVLCKDCNRRKSDL
ncbi:MAG: HNH endonuclease [Oscillospiraceae bacterium]|nr:HNH endonuclease [Oscillospiraceae bacterium]